MSPREHVEWTCPSHGVVEIVWDKHPDGWRYAVMDHHWNCGTSVDRESVLRTGVLQEVQKLINEGMLELTPRGLRRLK